MPPLRPSAQSRFPWQRVDAWIDAVYAIAATLLVLELRPPDAGEGHLAEALLHQWPLYLIYTLGFVQIAGGWSVLRRLSAWSEHLDHYALALAFTAQLGYVLTPFTMAVLADAVHDRSDFIAAVRLLAIVMSISMGAFAACFLYLRRGGFFRADLDPGLFNTAYTLSMTVAVWPLLTLALTFVIGPWALAVMVLHLLSLLIPLDAMSTEQYAEAADAAPSWPAGLTPADVRSRA